MLARQWSWWNLDFSPIDFVSALQYPMVVLDAVVEAGYSHADRAPLRLVGRLVHVFRACWDSLDV